MLWVRAPSSAPSQSPTAMAKRSKAQDTFWLLKSGYIHFSLTGGMDEANFYLRR